MFSLENILDHKTHLCRPYKPWGMLVSPLSSNFLDFHTNLKSYPYIFLIRLRICYQPNFDHLGRFLNLLKMEENFSYFNVITLNKLKKKRFFVVSLNIIQYYLKVFYI